jgi:hypothetical protein
MIPSNATALKALKIPFVLSEVEAHAASAASTDNPASHR